MTEETRQSLMIVMLDKDARGSEKVAESLLKAGWAEKDVVGVADNVAVVRVAVADGANRCTATRDKLLQWIGYERVGVIIEPAAFAGFGDERWWQRVEAAVEETQIQVSEAVVVDETGQVVEPTGPTGATEESGPPSAAAPPAAESPAATAPPADAAAQGPAAPPAAAEQAGEAPLEAP